LRSLAKGAGRLLLGDADTSAWGSSGHPSTADQALQRRGSLAGAIFRTTDKSARVAAFSEDKITQETYDAMEKDPIVRICQRFRKASILEAPRKCEGPDPRTEAIVEAVLAPHWDAIFDSCTRTGLFRGFAPHELVWERGDIEITYTPDTEQIQPGAVDAQGMEIVPDKAEPITETVNVWKIARLKPIQPANIISVQMDRVEHLAGFTPVSPGDPIRVEDAAVFWFQHQGRWAGAGYFGEPDGAAVYDPWYRKRILADAMQTWAKRFGKPIPHIGFAPGEQPDNRVDSNGQPIPGTGTSNATVAAEMVNDLLEMDDPGIYYPTGATVDADGNAGEWKIDFLELHGDGAKVYLDAIHYYDTQISYAMLTPEKTYSGEGTTGTYAMSQTHKDVADTITVGDLKEILAAVNKQLVPTIVKLNLGPDEPSPQYTTPGLDDARQLRLWQVLQTVLGRAIATGAVEMDWDEIDDLGLPVKNVSKEASVVESPTDPTKGTSAMDMSEATLLLAEIREATVALKADKQVARLKEAIGGR
jgi:hypothetical protein